MSSPANIPLLHHSITPLLLAEELHDIAPPVDYSLILAVVDISRSVCRAHGYRSRHMVCCEVFSTPNAAASAA